MCIIYLLTYLFFCSSYLFIIIIFLQQLLGVHLSDNLNWNEHVTVKKASKLLYAIFALKEVRTNCQAAYSSLLQHHQVSLRVCQPRFRWPHAIFNTTESEQTSARKIVFRLCAEDELKMLVPGKVTADSSIEKLSVNYDFQGLTVTW